MCGLAGIAAIGGDCLPPSARDILTGMGRAVAHRGPDGEQVFLEGPVGLEFRRLALVGAEAAGQPLFSHDEQTVLIANGEVYNHRELEAARPDLRLRTTSDCEILAHLYAERGLGFLADVCGMFALALWDRRRNQIVMARDRFGIKPLYFTRAGDQLIFASEIKGLFQHPGCHRELDWAGALADQLVTAAPYLAHDPVTTWFRGIEIVPAGGIVTVDLATGKTSHHQYWQLPEFGGGSSAPDGELIRRYREVLAASVADCASADAELGLFLSGGVDSAAVAALAAQATGKQIHTFSVLSASTLANGDVEAAHRAARAVALPNHQVIFEAERTPAVQEWKQLLWLLETPLCGAEQYYKYELYRYAKQVRPELRGMLLGQASDEFNGGYTTVVSDNGWAGFEAGISQLARFAAVQASPGGMGLWWQQGGPSALEDDVLRSIGASLPHDPYPAYVRAKYRDIQQYNCWHEDRTAAGNGVEARVPFLDHRLVELAASIPADRRASLLWDKRILREAVRDVLPPAIVQRPKVSFFYGDGEGYTHRMIVRMLLQDDGALVEEALAAPGAAGILRPGALRSQIRALADEMEPSGIQFVLRLVNLGLLDQMVRSLPSVPADGCRYPVLPVAQLDNWDTDIAPVREHLRRVSGPQPADVLALGGDVLVMQSPSDQDVLYVAVSGQIEYVADAAEDPAWCTFLREVNGQRTVREILASTGLSYASIGEVLRDALDAGLLIAIPVSCPPAAGALTASAS